MRRAPIIELSDSERKVLERWARGLGVAQRLVERAQIVLAASEGMTNQEIASALGCDIQRARRWRQRFADRRCAGIEGELSKTGRKPVVWDKVANLIIETTTQERPTSGRRWSTRTLAKHLGVNREMVRRVWAAAGLKPQRVTTGPA